MDILERVSDMKDHVKKPMIRIYGLGKATDSKNESLVSRVLKYS